MLLLCLTSSEEFKLCLQLSLPTFVLSSSVSQILLLKIRLFKTLTRLLANIYIPSLFKCKLSLHKIYVVMFSLLINWNLFFLHSSRKKSLTHFSPLSHFYTHVRKPKVSICPENVRKPRFSDVSSEYRNMILDVWWFL